MPMVYSIQHRMSAFIIILLLLVAREAIIKRKMWNYFSKYMLGRVGWSVGLSVNLNGYKCCLIGRVDGPLIVVCDEGWVGYHMSCVIENGWVITCLVWGRVDWSLQIVFGGG